MGRPTLYTPEIAETICRRIADGETLREICRSPGMPAKSTVYDWIEANPELSGRFARARAQGYDAIAEESLAIVDTKPPKVRTQFGEHVDAGFVSWLKNRAEQRLKLLAKWDPKRYGERMTLAGDPDAPLVTVKDYTGRGDRGER